jgi:23S rRNA G2445 N2-methylase RlmL
MVCPDSGGVFMNPILSKPLTFELFAAPGCLEEALLETEVIVSKPWKPHKFAPILSLEKGFVRVKNASWDFACELAARATTLHDVRLTFPKSRVHGWNDLPRVLEKLPWGFLLLERANLEFRCEAFAGVIPHAGRMTKIVEELFKENGFKVSTTEPYFRVHVTASGDFLRVAVSLGNDALHKRGWRASTGTLAPLREDIASAALWRLARFEPRVLEAVQIAVPFAGSGTLGLEAWQSLFGLPPSIWGVERPWQALTMPSAKTLEWWANRTTRAAAEALLPEIVFVENDQTQFQELEANVAQVRQTVQGSISCVEADAFKTDFLTRDGIVLLPLHPPYGLRMVTENPDVLYSKIGQSVQKWVRKSSVVGFCLCPSESTWRAFKASLEGMRVETSHLTQGGLDIRVCCFSHL